MQMPVNVSEVLKIATDMKEVASTPITVSLYIDEQAPGALVGHVRAAFASSAEHTRVTIDYIDEVISDPKPNEDMAVIIAGDSNVIGEQAKHLRDCGVPTMVVTNSPEKVTQIAADSGYPIPPADVIAPIRLESKIESQIRAKLPFLKVEDEEAENSGELAVGNDAETGEIPLTVQSMGVLDARMGKWIISACKQKDLALAMAFPFVRRPLANDSITATSLQNGAVGLVPFLPGADMPIMTLNQIKMVLQIATAYGQELDADRVKEIVAIVIGAFACRNIVRAATKAIPVAGWLFSGTMGFAATEAMGRTMIEYFEAGGDMVGVASVLQTVRDKSIEASKQAAKSPLGQKVMAKVKETAGELAKQKAQEQ